MKSPWTVALSLVAAVTALSIGCSSSSSSTTDTSQPDASTQADGAPSADIDAGDSNARSAPSQGGASGVVDSLAMPSFTFTTGAGQKVTVNTTSATTYENDTGDTTASAIVLGVNVLVAGIVDTTAITASHITVRPDVGDETQDSVEAGVIPFERGSQSAAKQDGQIPNYTEGEGTIVSGDIADQAAEAALDAYPGIVANRVVLLSGGEYEVHCIGVNWPHHVFVDPAFAVLGAN
ncbi:hypothetical protein LVJ94_05465 [Pendulispora rubella]|uniref:Secreted protein n=1 Tax=Pendulispora rubella TaxID=2741070 RepID=A0ABZ2L6X7_9BACT